MSCIKTIMNPKNHSTFSERGFENWTFWHFSLIQKMPNLSIVYILKFPQPSTTICKQIKFLKKFVLLTENFGLYRCDTDIFWRSTCVFCEPSVALILEYPWFSQDFELLVRKWAILGIWSFSKPNFEWRNRQKSVNCDKNFDQKKLEALK